MSKMKKAKLHCFRAVHIDCKKEIEHLLYKYNADKIIKTKLVILL